MAAANRDSMLHCIMQEDLKYGDVVYCGQRLFLPESPDCAQVVDQGRIYDLTPGAICVGHKFMSDETQSAGASSKECKFRGNQRLKLRIVKYTPNEDAIVIAILDIEDVPDLMDDNPLTVPNFLLFTPADCKVTNNPTPLTNVEACLTETESTGETKANHNSINPINNIQRYIIADTLGVVFSYLEFTEYQRHELKAYCLLFRDALPCVSYWTVNFPHPNIPTLTVLMEKMQADRRVKNEIPIVVEFPEGLVVLENEVNEWNESDINFPYRDNITYAGKGKDRTIVHGYCSVKKKKKVSLKGFTLINPCGGGCLSVRGFTDNENQQKTCVELYDMSLRQLEDEQGDDALDIRNGATVIAKRCEFSNVGGQGVDIQGIGTKATFYNCAFYKNDAAGVCCTNGALVELYGEDTVMHSNGEDDLQSYSWFTTPPYEGISASIIIYIPSLVINSDSGQQSHIYQQLSPNTLELTYLLQESEEDSEEESEEQEEESETANTT